MTAFFGIKRLRTCLRWTAWVLVAVLFGLMLSLIPNLKTSSELVRIRNALQLDTSTLDASWPGSSVPKDFLLDREPFPESFISFVKAHDGALGAGHWDRSLALAAALIPDRGRRRSGAIQSSMVLTLERIQTHGDGYCGDYADVFAGIATVAGIPSRRWSFSFDGFGGHGHIFNEIWDQATSSWRMLDLQHNFYPASQDGRPLSAIAFRAAIASSEPVRMLPIDAAASFGFKSEADALSYYRRGLDGWYMTWGNNLFEQDRVWLAGMLAPIHRALEQLATIVTGNAPGIRLMVTETNQLDVAQIHEVRVRIHATLVTGMLLLFVVACLLISAFSSGRSNQDRS